MSAPPPVEPRPTARGVRPRSHVWSAVVVLLALALFALIVFL